MILTLKNRKKDSTIYQGEEQWDATGVLEMNTQSGAMLFWHVCWEVVCSSQSFEGEMRAADIK